jgi:hypothetical protein
MDSSWQLCNADSQTCRLFNLVNHPMSFKEEGWTFSPFEGMDGGELRFHDQIKLVKVSAVDSNGFEWESSEYLEWYVDSHRVSYADMSPEEFNTALAELEAKLADLEANGGSEEEILGVKDDIADACAAVPCDDSLSSGLADEASDSGNLTLLISIVALVLIFGLLAGVLLMRGSKDELVENDWSNQVPATDMVANSMYGGAQQLFQQQYAQPVVTQTPVSHAPVAPAQPGVLPLPPGGLPAGWTMEQWSYYGHTYLEQTGQ